jgi:RecG-like helicase
VSREALERKFQKLGLRRGVDFILHLPLRYEDETVLGSADSAVPGEPLLSAHAASSSSTPRGWCCASTISTVAS